VLLGVCTLTSKLCAQYLGQIEELYRGLFHITHLPAVTSEVRGVPALTEFAPLLMRPNEQLAGPK
jgi:hypothetical protein